MRYIVGNRLATDGSITTDGRRINLHEIRSPIVDLCSKGDTITPQALGWITNLYASVDDIRAHGQEAVHPICEAGAARRLRRDELRHDPVLGVVSGRLEARPNGRGRRRCAPLAGKSTLNRLEHDTAAIERLLVDLFLGPYAAAPVEIVLDLDATDDPPFR